MRTKSFVFLSLVVCAPLACATRPLLAPPKNIALAKPPTTARLSEVGYSGHSNTQVPQEDPVQLQKDMEGMSDKPYFRSLLAMPNASRISLEARAILRTVAMFPGNADQPSGLYQAAAIAYDLYELHPKIVGAISGLTERQGVCVNEVSELRTQLVAIKAQLAMMQTQIRTLQAKDLERMSKPSKSDPKSTKKKKPEKTVGPVEDPLL